MRINLQKRIVQGVPFIPVFLTLFFSNFLSADTIYLKNKSRVDGMIESESQDTVDIHLGYGTVTFHRSEIDRIVRSDAKETEAIWKTWGEEQREIERRKPEEDKKWRERQAELDRLRREEEKLKKEKDEFAPKVIRADAKNGQMLMDTLLNGEVSATLVLDSGAGLVVVSRRLADKLGIEPDKLKKSRMQVADGRWVEMGLTTLKSIRVQSVNLGDTENPAKTGVEMKNVEACVVLEEPSGKNVNEDGLLGMTFLKNFKFNADYNNGTVTFERLKDSATDLSKKE